MAATLRIQRAAVRATRVCPLQSRTLITLPSWPLPVAIPTLPSSPSAAPRPQVDALDACIDGTNSNDGAPSLLQLAALARRAYSPASKMRPSPSHEQSDHRWKYVWEDSHNDPATGVHLHTWQRGRDVVITARGTELDTAAHLLGNLSLLRGERFSGANETRERVLRIVDRYKQKGARLWLTGHSRGAALLQFAALPCSDDVEAVVGFESPGIPVWMVNSSAIACRNVFMDFYTYPNFITLLHPAVNVNQRFHIPTKLAPEADNSWDHVTRCVSSDLNRVANWILLGSVVARTAASTARVMGVGSSSAEAAAAGLEAAQEYTRYFQGRGLWSARLAFEDFGAAHSIDGIVDYLAQPRRDRSGAIRKIVRWPSDHHELKHPLKALARFATDTLRNELLFNQADLAGIHNIREGGMQAMWEARMGYLWGDWCELCDQSIEESKILPSVSSRQPASASNVEVRIDAVRAEQSILST